jgi:hypothetical protein
LHFGHRFENPARRNGSPPQAEIPGGGGAIANQSLTVFNKKIITRDTACALE